MLRLWVLSNPNVLFTNERITVSDSESSPAVETVENVEGDVNVGDTEATEATEGDDTADDGSQQDTGELQE